jgi:hypothetical protein
VPIWQLFLNCMRAGVDVGSRFGLHTGGDLCGLDNRCVAGSEVWGGLGGVRYMVAFAELRIMSVCKVLLGTRMSL